MSVEFRLLWQEIGGGPSLYPRSTIVIPYRQTSLVLMLNAGKTSPAANNLFDVTEVGRDKVGKALGDYVARFLPAGASAKRAGLESALNSQIQHALSHDGKL